MKDEDTTNAVPNEPIEQYRKQLVAEAGLADGDLDEIEDHLRLLTAELRDSGMPAAEAVTEAARRLGDPKQVAREHARVRSPFGHLPRARAWSAALLLVPPLLMPMLDAIGYGLTRGAVELGFGVPLALGMIARVPWARPIVFGAMAFFLLPTLFATILWGQSPLWLVWHLGVLAFVMPWRRSELPAAGWNLVLQVWTYGASTLALAYQFTSSDGTISVVMPLATVAMGCAVVGTCGGILRARWGAFASALGAVALLGAIGAMWSMRIRLAHPDLFATYLLGLVSSGAVAAAVAARLAWRTARSTFGTLQHVLR